MPQTPLADQFQALQSRLQSGECEAARAMAEALLAADLEPLQRALVLQLQGTACLNNGQGDRAAAKELWQQSLQLRWSPQLALQCLELELLPAVNWAERNRWLTLMQQLISRGEGLALLRCLSWWLEELPLRQQRQELLTALEQELPLRPEWQRLQRCAAGR